MGKGFSGGYGGGRGGFGGGVNMNAIKKMQEDMLKAQAEVEEGEFSATSGGGMVTATASGKRELTKLEIDRDAIIEAEGDEDVELLQDAIVAAVNEALHKAEDAMSQNMSKLTGGLNLGF